MNTISAIDLLATSSGVRYLARLFIAKKSSRVFVPCCFCRFDAGDRGALNLAAAALAYVRAIHLLLTES